jgi:signal transduction histidine kinase
MGLITLVLLITFTALIISSANRMKTDSFRNLDEEHMKLYSEFMKPPTDTKEETLPIIKKEKPFDGNSFFPTFFLTLDSEGTVRSVEDYGRELSEETFIEAAAQAVAQDKTEGVINSLNLRYKVFEKDGENTVIGFIDISYERNFIRQQVINYCLIGIASLIAFFIISLVLSKIAIKPVQTAWKKQQQFVADASHELKTPITVVLANTSILLSGSVKDTGEQKKWISYIELEARRMKKLVEDMLFLARVDSKEKEEVFTKISLSDAVLTSTLPFEAVMYEYHKTLKCDIGEGLYIKGDAGQIKQLVYILLDNANKYAKEDSEVKVSLKKEGAKAALSVNNSGEPIDSKDIGHIFDRFIRADKARTGGKNSYGLGLAIAKEIAEFHGGKISVESNIDEGTTFSIVLPLV